MQRKINSSRLYTINWCKDEKYKTSYPLSNRYSFSHHLKHTHKNDRDYLFLEVSFSNSGMTSIRTEEVDYFSRQNMYGSDNIIYQM